MSELEYSRITKFLIDNKLLRAIPGYKIFRYYLIHRYVNKLLEHVAEVGDYTINHIENIVTVSDKYKLRIGKFSSIGGGVSIILSSGHRTDWISTYPFVRIEDTTPLDHVHDSTRRNNLSAKGDVVIGNDVWIGLNAIIMPGVKIGDGAVIGAGSVVTKNVEDYEIVGGNPAKHIRYRFKKEEIIELKRITWWDWPIEKIVENKELIESPDIKKFIKNFKKG